MKQKDIVLIVVIAVISAIASFLISNKLFVGSSNKQQQYEVVDVINTSFQKPSKTYFNMNSINPTQNSAVSTDNNQDPFNGTSQ